MMNLQNSEVSLAPKVSQQSDFHKAFDYAKLDPVTIKNLLRKDWRRRRGASLHLFWRNSSQA